MVDEPSAPEVEPPEPPAETPPKARRKTARRSRADAELKEEATPSPSPAPEQGASEKGTAEEGPRTPRRAELPVATRSLLSLRRTLDRKRPIFGRQAANRYFRIGRDGSWRRPRGLQSKQRRHYGYRAKLVRVGYRSPARVRGLVPSGFRPILVHTLDELGEIDPRTQAAVIGRTVGTRRRLALEEEARKLGIRVLNPIVKSETEA